MSVSNDLNYNFTQGLDGSESRSFAVMPNNGSTQSAGGIIRMTLPRESNGYLNPAFTTLKFSINNTDDDTVMSVGLATDAIQSMSIYSGSSLIEYVDGVNFLQPILQAAGGQNAEAAYTGMENILMGAAGTSAVPTGLTIAAGAKHTYCVPLSFSGVLGGGNSRFLPLDADLRVEFMISQKVNMVKCAAGNTGTPTITDIQMDIQIVSLPFSVAESIRFANGGQIVIGSKQYRHYSAASAGSEASQSIVLPVRATDVLSLLVSHNNLDGTQTALSTLNRGRCNLTQYQFRVGSQQRPSVAPTSDEEQFAHFQSAWHGVGDPSVGKPISRTTWAIDTSADSAVGSYVSALELESFSHQAKIQRGVDTNNLTVFYEPRYSSSVASTLHMYSYILCKLVLQDGVYSLLV